LFAFSVLGAENAVKLLVIFFLPRLKTPKFAEQSGFNVFRVSLFQRFSIVNGKKRALAPTRSTSRRNDVRFV